MPTAEKTSVRAVQLAEVDQELLRTAARDGDVINVFDGEDPIIRIVPAGAELARRHEFFVHFPHDASECLYTCWRHPSPSAKAAGPRPKAHA